MSALTNFRHAHAGLQRAVTALLGLAIALLLVGCDAKARASAADSKREPVSVELRVEALLADMTLEQKVGQMIQAEIKHVTPDDIRRYGIGSVLNGGGSFPGGNKHATRQEWLELADAYYAASKDTSLGNAGIPLIWGTDAVHGHNNVIGATLFPHNIGLGAANDPALLRKIGEITAQEVAATGIDWIFAPTVAVVKDDRWGRTYEGYSDRSEIVEAYAPQIVSGIQSQGMVATAKHFIGDGGTFKGVDQGDTRLDLAQLLEQHGKGYVTALEAGVLTVMASFNSWNGDKIHGNKTLLTDVLKQQMGFDGFVVSDWNGIGQVEGCENDSCPQAINAGIDMVMAPEDWKTLFQNMVTQVRMGEIPEARIDDAVRRILRVKIRAGLLEAPKPSVRALALADNSIGSDDHRAVAREAVRKSLVLLKNDNATLPLNPSQKVLVAGPWADNIGVQNGGWTITWQGTGNNNDDFPHGSSILDGITQQVESAGGTVIHSPDGRFVAGHADERPDVAIVVFGETPYAEGQGDVLSLAWQPNLPSDSADADVALLNKLRAQGIPVVAVLITGRPLWVNRELNAADAFVAAWLPGSEGAGVAEVLFTTADGAVQHDFTGRLAFDWPNKDLNAGDVSAPVTDNLFPYGYGLSYRDAPATMAKLDESAIGFEESLDKTVFSRGDKAPWQLYVGDPGNWGKPFSGGQTTSDQRRIMVEAVDYQVQEDARKVTWMPDSGDAAIVFWQSDEPMDLVPLKDAGGALAVTVKLDSMPAKAVQARMDCGYPCNGAVNLTGYFHQMPQGQWVQLAIPLSCFEHAGLDMARVNTPLVLSSSGAMSITIADVSLLSKAPTAALACSS